MPLPAGYTLDKPGKSGKSAATTPASSTPKLPPGYTLDPASAAEDQTAAAAPPDLTSNPQGEGLYRMAAPAGDESGRFTGGEIQVPFSQVQAAQSSGYSLHPDEAPRYQKDVTHIGKGPTAYEQVKSLLARMTEPMPDRPVDPSHPFQSAPAALTNVGQLPFNMANRAIRGVAGLPAGMVGTARGISQGDPAALESLNPATMGESASRSLTQDASSLGPVAALANLGGDATTLYLAGRYGPRVAETATKPMSRLLSDASSNPELTLAQQTARNMGRPDFRGAGRAILKPVESAARGLTDTGTGPVRRLVEDRQAANEKIAATNAEAQTNNQAAAQTLELRRQHEQAYQQATAEHYARESAADLKAKSEENAAWSAWRQKTAGKTLDGGQIASPLQRLRLDSPEVDRTLNQLEPRGDEVPQESPYAQIRERTSQQQYGKDYQSLSPVKQDQIDDLLHTNGYSPDPIAFDPQVGQPISIDRVQRASSILQRYIRNGRFEGPLLGEMKQVAKVLHNAVTRASADAGAAADLAAARESTVTYQGAFGRERRTPTTARTVREQQANPEAFRERTNEERLARTRRYDPSLVDSYRQVKAAREALKKFPSEDQLRKGLKPITAPQTISLRDLTAARRVAMEASAGKWWTRGRWAAAAPIIWAMRGVFGGHIPNIGMVGLESGGILAATRAATNLLRYPPLVRFLVEAQPSDLAVIPPELRGDLPGLVSQAQRAGIKVSPALAAATAGAVTSARQPPGGQAVGQAGVPAAGQAAGQPVAGQPAIQSLLQSLLQGAQQ